MTTLPATPPEASSPYGLEAHRVALLRRRRRGLLALILVALLGVLGFIAMSVEQSSDIDTFGSGGNSVPIPVPEKQRERAAATLSVSPGRTTVLDRPIQTRESREPGEPPADLPSGGLNWVGLLQVFGPPIAGAALAWRAGRKRFVGGLEEVNLGVYKGAMPLELHTASHRKYVFTTRMAMAPLFGARVALAQAVARGAARFERVR